MMRIFSNFWHMENIFGESKPNQQPYTSTTTKAYHLYEPSTWRSPFIFSSPHSGSHYYPSFLKQSSLSKNAIRSSEDAFVDELFFGAVQLGMPLIAACAPRAFVDMNRSDDELDPALITGILKHKPTPYIFAGLGVIPRVVTKARAIYTGKITHQEAQERINTYWRPYHHTLQKLTQEAHERWGESILLDCHSMPFEALTCAFGDKAHYPDIVLGDRHGTSASQKVTDKIETAFQSAGFYVARNTPFSGAYITEFYGKPNQRYHAVQIEINRSLYMNETTIETSADFEHIKMLITNVIQKIIE